MRLTVCTALAIALAAPGFAQNLAGFQDLTIPAPHHGRDLVAGVWYPTTATGKATMLGENPVFTGHPALKGAGWPRGCAVAWVGRACSVTVVACR